MKTITLFTAAILLVWNSAGLKTNASAYLAFHPKKGLQYDEVVEFAQHITVMLPAGQGSQESQNNITVYSQAESLGQDGEKNTDISQSITRMIMSMNTGGMSMEIDTDTKGEGSDMSKQIYDQIKDIINAKSVSTIDPTGKVINVEMDEMTKQKLEQFGANASDNSYNALPNQKIKVGSTWHQEKDTKAQGMIMTANINYKLTAIKGDIAEVEMTGTITSKPDPEAAETMPAEVKITSATITGDAKVDIPSGLFVETVADFMMDMEVSTMGMTMDSKVKQTFTRTLTIQ